MTFEIEIAGRIRLVTVSPATDAMSAHGRVRVVVEDAFAEGMVGAPGVATYDVSAQRSDRGLSFVYVDDARSVDAIVTRQARGTYVIDLPRASLTATVDGGRVRRDRTREDTGFGDQRITAPLPGRIVKVLVAAGEDVRARQDLVVIEAMKMENALPSLRAGRVREVLVSEGTSVEAGRLLLVIDPAS